MSYNLLQSSIKNLEGYENTVDAIYGDIIYVHQSDSMLCWAASIEMLFNFYKYLTPINVKHTDIATQLPPVDPNCRINCPNNFQNFINHFKNINHKIPVLSNQYKYIEFSFIYYNSYNYKHEELFTFVDNIFKKEVQLPIGISYKNPIGGIGHCVVLTGLVMLDGAYTLICRDPGIKINNGLRIFKLDEFKRLDELFMIHL